MSDYRVVTRYYGPTNYNGAYITVRLDGGRVWRSPYDYGAENAHEQAVRDAFERKGFVVRDVTYQCEARGGRGNVYMVQVEREEK